MDRVFLAVLLVLFAVMGRMIFLPENSVLGTVITLGAVITFFGWCHWMISSGRLQQASYSDPNGPNQGWDSRTIEAPKRRADGIE